MQMNTGRFFLERLFYFNNAIIFKLANLLTG
jgi:hypothetical protein